MNDKMVCFRIRRIYFDLIVEGEKKEELRSFSTFWIKRLLCQNPPNIAVFVCGKNTHRRRITGVSVDRPEKYLGRELSEQGKKDVPTYNCIVTHLGEIVV